MDAPQPTIRRAKRLRRTLTPPEARLWVALRQKPDGLKFRRQHPIGRYVLDFYCDAAKLAVEVDGAAHDIVDIAVRDRRRDAWLDESGIMTLRFAAIEIGRSLDEVMDVIVRTALSRCPLRPLRVHLPQMGEES